jgi:hypothetical protein
MKNKRKGMDLLFQFHLWHRLNKKIKTQRNQIHKEGEENQRQRLKLERCREGRGGGWGVGGKRVGGG